MDINDLKKLKVKQLRNLCSQNGLDRSGRKGVLVNRLSDYYESINEPEVEPEVEPEEPVLIDDNKFEPEPEPEVEPEHEPKHLNVNMAVNFLHTRPLQHSTLQSQPGSTATALAASDTFESHNERPAQVNLVVSNINADNAPVNTPTEPQTETEPIKTKKNIFFYDFISNNIDKGEIQHNNKKKGNINGMLNIFSKLTRY